MGDKWILDDDGNPVSEPDLMKWADWFGDAQKNQLRVVARTDVSNYEVSTVFLALDYSFGGPEPILYETMVFAKGAKPGVSTNDDGFFDRYSTREEALQGHERIVGLVKKKQALQ